MVAQASFLLTTFKYILAIVLDDVTEAERDVLGWVLISLDVCFVLGSVGCLFAVFYLLTTHVKKEIDEEHVEKMPGSTTKVVPMSVDKKIQAEEIRGWGRAGGGGDGEKGMVKEEEIDITSNAQQRRRVSRRSSNRRSSTEQAIL